MKDVNVQSETYETGFDTVGDEVGASMVKEGTVDDAAAMSRMGKVQELRVCSTSRTIGL